ncbi:hypothetical protein [Lactococcus phage PMBT68]|nr:hypothetical protein [Lactococcus phage P1411]
MVTSLIVLMLLRKSFSVTGTIFLSIEAPLFLYYHCIKFFVTIQIVYISFVLHAY